MIFFIILINQIKLPAQKIKARKATIILPSKIIRVSLILLGMGSEGFSTLIVEALNYDFLPESKELRSLEIDVLSTIVDIFGLDFLILIVFSYTFLNTD